MDQHDEALKPQDDEAVTKTSAADEPGPKAPEACLWSGRTHWKHFSGKIALWCLASLAYILLVRFLASKISWFAGTPAWWIGGVPIVLTGAFFGGRLFVRVASYRYRLTQERLFIDRGLLTRTTDQTELIRVDDLRVRRSFADRIFGLGSVEVLSTDVSDRQITIEGIAGADEVAEAIRGQMRSLRKKSLFIENL